MTPLRGSADDVLDSRIRTRSARSNVPPPMSAIDAGNPLIACPVRAPERAQGVRAEHVRLGREPAVRPDLVHIGQLNEADVLTHLDHLEIDLLNPLEGAANGEAASIDGDTRSNCLFRR